MNKEIIKNLLKQAYQIAQDYSTDKNTHVGALLIKPDDFKIVTWGVNTFVNKKYLKNPFNHLRPLKYKLTEHAERAAIYKAAKLGIPTNNLILISTWACCPECARGIVLAGIKEVYTHKQTYNCTPENWYDEIELGIKILKNSDINYNLFDGEIGNVKNLFNGKVWYP